MGTSKVKDRMASISNLPPRGVIVPQLCPNHYERWNDSFRVPDWNSDADVLTLAGRIL